MKHKLIGLLIFLAGWANAQIGIDLTEMIPAPDSGYMIITTGDEYPDRGLQKYVRASDVLGIDTMFQNGDSLCILMRSEEAYRCFPVHREVRLELVDGGLRVCWESRDTIWETRNYLHFPGTSGSYVEARDIHDFEIGDEDAEIEVEWRRTGDANLQYWAATGGLVNNIGFALGTGTNNIRFSDGEGNVTSGTISSNSIPEKQWSNLLSTYISSQGEASIYLNNQIWDKSTVQDLSGKYISNTYALILGSRTTTATPVHGDIRYFRFNDEYFDFSEGEGDTIVSNFGTVMDIKGDVEWRKDTTGFTLSEFHYCDTIHLNDIHVTSFTRSGDSLYLDLSNGQTFAVRDSFLTEQEIQSMVNKSWLLKDGGVPDNATDTVYRDGVAVIEGETWEKEISSNSLDLRSTSPIWLPSFFLRAFVEDEDNPVVADRIYSTPYSTDRRMTVSKRDFSEYTTIALDSRDGIRFQPYGTGKFEATPTYLLGVDASGYIKEVRPTSGIDTIVHLGDSIYFDFDDKTFTIRDSVRSDADIITLIESHRIFQQLGRSGDFITLSEGGGQVLDLHLKDVQHTGDSIRLIMSDGRIFSVRDSSLSVETVRDMIIEEIPETVFYVHSGGATFPMKWHDTLTIDGAQIIVNETAIEVSFDKETGQLEVCQTTPVLEGTYQDSVVVGVKMSNGQIMTDFTYSSQLTGGRYHVLEPVNKQYLDDTVIVTGLEWDYIERDSFSYVRVCDTLDIGMETDGIDTLYSTSDSLYIITSTGRTLSAGVSKGDKGDGLEYHWDGTRLGVRVENSGDPFVYVDLKGDKGDTGDDGREVELRVDSEMIQWRYVGDNWQNLLPLSALKGEKGDTGPGLEYAWDGTKLGVRVEGSGDPFVYVDLKGDKGDPGDVVGDINIYKDDGVILEDRTATIEEDNTLKFDLKENARFDISHFSQEGNDSKFVHQRWSDESFSLQIQEIEKDTLWSSRILATSKEIALINHALESSHSYGTMGVDTSGSYILNLVKDNPGVLFAGRRQFLKRVSDDGHALWDTLGIQDIGITPADTARWGSGGGDDDYTLEMDGYQTHLRDGSGASKGFFQIGGTDGIEVYTEANNNRYRVGISNNFFPQWSLAFSNNALQLRRDNVTQSTVGFVGTGGINIQSTAGSLTIDGSAIGGTQSLSFNPSLAQTTLSGGGGSFRIVGGANTNVSLSAGGVYTISATGGGSMPSYSFNSQGAMLQLSEDGIQRGSYELRGGTGISLSTSGSTLNRVVTINASGGSSPWTVSGSNIYRNSGVTIGSTSVANNQFRVYNGARFYDGIGLWSGSTNVGSLTASGNTVTMESSQNYYINSNNVRFKTQSSSAGAGLGVTATVAAAEGSVIIPTANMTNGTMKIIINKRSSGHIRVFVANDREVHLPARSSLLVVYFDGEWYPQYIP